MSKRAKPVQARLNEQEYALVKVAARITGRTIDQFVRQAIREYLDREVAREDTHDLTAASGASSVGGPPAAS